MKPADCVAIGGACNPAYPGVVPCQVDWCDADTGTKTGTSYVPGVVGSCDKKVASGGHVMRAKWCRSAGGSFPYSSGHNEDSLVTCEVDYCEVETKQAIGTRPFTGANFNKCDWYHDADVCALANGCRWSDGICSTQTETPVIILAANDNLAVHVWGGFDEGNHLRLHNDEEHAKSTALSQYSIVDIGDGKVIICLQFDDFAV